jgi:nicotinamidase-related amidase
MMIAGEKQVNDWQDDTLRSYQDKGFAERAGFGNRPALLIVDFINGFTDPASPLGGDFSTEVAVTAKLLAAFRAASLPIAYTTIEYDADFRDAGVFIKKVPSLAVLLRGSPMCEIDARLRPMSGEYIASKKYASAFFGTNMDTYFRTHGVDTVVITGATTSGCVRASAVDSLQYGFYTIVVSDAVGDRAQGPHDANLFDMDAKYADVMPSAEVGKYLETLSKKSPGVGQDGFQRWWAQGDG